MKSSSAPVTFTSFILENALVGAIKERGFIHPTSVQLQAIPEILEGHDVLAGAETGSGKTAAYSIPLLHNLIQQREKEGLTAARGEHVRAIVLVPTRELAVQVREEITQLAKYIEPAVKCRIAVGGEPLQKQAEFFAKGVDVLVATPERLLDLNSIHALKFNKMRTLVIDEVDRMTADAFREEFDLVLKRFPQSCQKLMFTATLPESIRELVRKILDEPVIINVDPRNRPRFEQFAYLVNTTRKHAATQKLIEDNDWKQVLVFCNTKKHCDELQKSLETAGIAARALHGNLSIEHRKTAMKDFRNEELKVLIATDIAARGIDIVNLPCVINYELPREPTDFVHRMGRTGRTGTSGTVITLVAPSEQPHFSVIKERCGLPLETEILKGFRPSKEDEPEAPKSGGKSKKTKTSKRDIARKEAKQKHIKTKLTEKAKGIKAAAKIKAAESNTARAAKAAAKAEDKKSSSPWGDKAAQDSKPAATENASNATPAAQTTSANPWDKAADHAAPVAAVVADQAEVATTPEAEPAPQPQTKETSASPWGKTTDTAAPAAENTEVATTSEAEPAPQPQAEETSASPWGKTNDTAAPVTENTEVATTPEAEPAPQPQAEETSANPWGKAADTAAPAAENTEVATTPEAAPAPQPQAEETSASPWGKTTDTAAPVAENTEAATTPEAAPTPQPQAEETSASPWGKTADTAAPVAEKTEAVTDEPANVVAPQAEQAPASSVEETSTETEKAQDDKTISAADIWKNRR